MEHLRCIVERITYQSNEHVIYMKKEKHMKEEIVIIREDIAYNE